MLPIKIGKSRERKSWYLWCQECKIGRHGYPWWTAAMMGAQWHYNQTHKPNWDLFISPEEVLKVWTEDQLKEHYYGGGAPESNRNL